MKCEICKKKIKEDDLDWDVLEQHGVYVHEFCVKAKSIIIAKPDGVKEYSKITGNDLDKAIEENIIKIMPSGQ